MINCYLRTIPFIISRFLLRGFCLVPIDRKKIFFESYSGKGYVCNPKYISENLHENNQRNYKIVWGFLNPEFIEKTYYKAVKHNSILYFYERLTSKVIITNVADGAYIPKRKEQVLINTWHAGGAYKRVGKSFDDKNDKLTEWQTKIISKSTDVFLSSSRLFTKYNIEEGYGYKKKILEIGMPRNDMFFSEDKIIKAANKVNETYEISNEVIVLFAPTFRQDDKKDRAVIDQFPFEEVSKKIEMVYGRKCIFFLRSHHYSLVGEISSNKRSRFVNVTSYPDMQELLARADILITDYSSCMWDFSLMGRLCLLYVPDKKDYENNRGFYMPIESWPGYICENTEELLTSINERNIKEAKNIAEHHIETFGSYEKGTATETIMDLIRLVLEDKNGK